MFVVKCFDDIYLFVFVLGGWLIFWLKFCVVVGVNKLCFLELELVLVVMGYECGMIVLIGSIMDWFVYVDEIIVGQCIVMGVGVYGYSLFVDVDDLIVVYGVIVVDILVFEEC